MPFDPGEGHLTSKFGFLNELISPDTKCQVMVGCHLTLKELVVTQHPKFSISVNSPKSGNIFPWVTSIFSMQGAPPHTHSQQCWVTSKFSMSGDPPACKPDIYLGWGGVVCVWFFSLDINPDEKPPEHNTANNRKYFRHVITWSGRGSVSRHSTFVFDCPQLLWVFHLLVWTNLHVLDRPHIERQSPTERIASAWSESQKLSTYSAEYLWVSSNFQKFWAIWCWQFYAALQSRFQRLDVFHLPSCISKGRCSLFHPNVAFTTWSFFLQVCSSQIHFTFCCVACHKLLENQHLARKR